MDDPKSDDRKADHLKLATPSLKAAVRRARVENAERSEAVDELRQAELLRLEGLLEAIRPVLDQAPEGVDLFDVGIARGERPRLFLDMIAFVEMGHDRRTYRFFQDTRNGRVLIAESAEADRVVAAMTNYIARRLVERERALAADARARPTRIFEPPPAMPPRGNGTKKRSRALVVAADLTRFALLTIGVFAVIGLVALAAWRFWATFGRAWWIAQFGSLPF